MNRRVLITGGTRGIGKAISKAFVEAKYRVTATYAGNDSAAGEFEDEVNVKTFKWDVSDFEACSSGIAKVEEYLGGNIEILVNNAGITRDSMMHKMPVESWNNVLHTNLSSVFNMSRAVIEKMKEAKFGRIVNLSSVNAQGALGQTNYSAAKAGIEGFTKALALEGARNGITANAVAPGYINTEMVAAMPEEALKKVIAKVPVGRLGDPEEIARVVLFLAHNDSGFITGTIIPINGGLRV